MGIVFNPLTGQFNFSAAGGGGVAGPGSSTDNAIVRFDGTGGGTLQDSGVTIDDSDNIVMVSGTQITGSDGTAAAPTFTFGSQTNMGWYRSGNNKIGMSTSGGAKLELDSTFLRHSSGWFFSGGTKTESQVTYSNVNDANSGLNTGMRSDQLSMVTGGVSRMLFNTVKVEVKLPFMFDSYDDSGRSGLTPEAGWVIYNTTDNNLNIYDGTNWILPDGTTA